MISSINTSSCMNIYKQQTINTGGSLVAAIEPTSRSFAECIQAVSAESKEKTEDLWGKLEKATSGMCACTKCGTMYLGQEPPAVCGKCGNETKTGEDEPLKAEEDAGTNAANAVSELNNNNISTLLELETSVLA